MTKGITNNPCTRCGKQRITIGTFKEKIGNSYVTSTKTACPDKNCQEMVIKKLKEEKDKRDQLAFQKNERLKKK